MGVGRWASPVELGVHRDGSMAGKPAGYAATGGSGLVSFGQFGGADDAEIDRISDQAGQQDEEDRRDLVAEDCDDDQEQEGGQNEAHLHLRAGRDATINIGIDAPAPKAV